MPAAKAYMRYHTILSGKSPKPKEFSIEHFKWSKGKGLSDIHPPNHQFIITPKKYTQKAIKKIFNFSDFLLFTVFIIIIIVTDNLMNVNYFLDRLCLLGVRNINLKMVENRII